MPVDLSNSDFRNDKGTSLCENFIDIADSLLELITGMTLFDGNTAPITSPVDTTTYSVSFRDSSTQNILAKVWIGCSVMVLMLLGDTIYVLVAVFRYQTATVMDSVDLGVAASVW